MDGANFGPIRERMGLNFGSMRGRDRTPVGGERWVVALFAAIVLFGFGLEVARDFTPAKSSVLFMLLAMPVLLVLHELGHAAVAALLGWKICRIVIGYGRPLLSLKLGGVPTEIRLLPIGGHVLPAPLRLRRPRLENVLIYAAGPGAELVLVLLLAAVVGVERLLTPTTDLAVIAVQSIALLVAIDLFTNLVPIPMESESGTVWNDGLGIVMSPFLPRWHFQRAATLPWVLRADQSSEAEARAQVFEEGVAGQPDNPFMRLHLADALVELDPERAEDERRRALGSGELPEDLAAALRRELGRDEA